MQTKDTLTLRASSFGSKCEMPDAFLKKVANSGVVDLILSFASFKADKELKKGDGAKRQRITGGSSQGGAVHYGCCMPTACQPQLERQPPPQLQVPACLPPCLRPAGIPKLEDANDAGGRNSEHCTLILTEGDSAKSLAVAGLSVVGRDRFGVFPLRCGCGRPGVLQ